MFLFVIFCVLAVITLILIGVGLLASDSEARLASFGGAGVVALISVVFLFFSCVTTVDTKNVGVLTTFGRPTGYLDNGFHFKAPWQKTTELNDAIQTDTYATEPGSTSKQDGAVSTGVHVRIERQATATVNVSIRWQIRPEGVEYLFRNYKNNDAITDNLVLRNLQVALNDKFSNYDPLGLDANGKNSNESLDSYAKDVRLELAGSSGSTGVMGKYIDVLGVSIPYLSYDSATEAQVSKLVSQIAATRVAAQQVQTNIQQSKANGVLSKSVSDDPNVLTDKCLNILKEAVDKGISVTGAPSCFPGGSGSGVLVNGK